MDERFAGLLPETTAVHTMTADAPLSVLTDAERDFIARAVPSRQGEFAAARACARRALGDLGLGNPGSPVSLVPGPERDITWPTGTLGSITHCTGLRAAAVTRVGQDDGSRVVGLGIDAEPHEPMDMESVDMVTVAAERRMLRRLTARWPSVVWERVLFSAKESVFKTWFPLTRTWLDFTECELSVAVGHSGTVVQPDISGTFHGRFLVPGPRVGGRELTGVDGRWRIAGGHIVTAVCLIVRGH
ncbi:4'-phosphopantetheinyl transferase family protein [Corynebacterium neomassiliense]|uniref:4'-phosphopantetheinyl transferase family protein n=1 Tax=Corynebacterium neomassiliense TaxID=2079482 RepID=UPI00192A6686|nr:4'-phosphopantetheinyl transferase superfamily protein [Corynebacterium neomassiliense]